VKNMDTRKTSALALLMLVAVLMVPSFAAGLGATAGSAMQAGSLLTARVQHLSCTVDFTTTVMNEVASAVPQGSAALTADIAKLNGDESQLSSLASAGDPNAFDSFVSGTLTSDVRQGISDLHAARRGFAGGNVTSQTLAQLESGYSTAHSTLVSCNNGAVSALLQGRINQFTAVINGWNGRISALGAKGFDTAAMQAVASGAASQVVTPLQNALQSGDQAQMEAALQTYCIGDECAGVNGSQPYDYHGFAQMALATLQAEVSKAGTDPLIANLTAAGITVNSSALSDATQQLDNVSSTLASVGTAKYAAGQDQAIESSLKQAATDLVGFTQALRQDVQQLREQRMAERASRIGNYTRNGNYTAGRGVRGGYPGNFSGYHRNGTAYQPPMQPATAGNQTQ
jgi:hypothetical protein